MKQFLLLSLLALTACTKPQTTPQSEPLIITAAVLPNKAAIRIEDIANESPRFERVYRVNLSKGRSMVVKIKTFIGITKSGELDQPGGRWIFFDPDAVADKILDPDLAPIVQAYCDEINTIDKLFRDSKPAKFTDESGVTWERVGRGTEATK